MQGADGVKVVLDEETLAAIFVRAELQAAKAAQAKIEATHAPYIDWPESAPSAEPHKGAA